MIWSFVLTGTGIFGLWLTGRKSRWGFASGLLTQVLWLAYAIATQQWGFILSCVLFGFLYGRNFYRWAKEPPT